jgi:integrase
VSVTVFALGAWVLHLLYRPYRKGLLDAASIKRYMDTLSHGFVSFGYRLDLADLDGDELTEFYRCVLDGLDAGSDDKTDDETLDTRGKSNRQRNENYVLQRLEEFHRFAAQRFGLEAPDWAEIGDGVISSLSNPGTITEQEYLHALQQLCPEPFEGAASSTRDAFVLMLVFRFGLRGGEAIGLRWNNWIDISGAVVVLVSSRYRQLKTRGSQRQVPLLEKLTDHELLIIRRWQAYWSTESGNTESVPLFFDEGDRNQVTALQPVRSRILTAVRSATGNAGTTLHHARHAFANRLFEYLVHRNSIQIWAFHQSQDEVVASSARQSLLATNRPTRRTSWAIARLLGHVTKSTTFGSYLHVQFDWAAQCVASSNEHRFTDVHLKKLRSATNIDTWAIESRNFHTPIKIATDHFEKCSPTRALKFCRLRAQGLPARLAGEQCQLRQENWTTIEDALCMAGRKLASSGLEMDDTVSSLTFPMVLLGRIHRKRWQTLIDYIETQEEGLPPPKMNFSEPIGQQIGKSRQLLLWTKNHFDQLRQFMEWMGIPIDQLYLYRPARVDARIIAWADMVGFSKLKETHPKKGKKAFQLDVASEDKVGAPAVVHPHRLAAVSNSANKIFQDNYEFLLVWLVFSIGQVSDSSDGTSIL